MALNGRVLLLNQTYEPLGTVSVARAVIMTFKNTRHRRRVRWRRVLRSAHAEFPVPSVIRRRTYINVRRRREAVRMQGVCGFTCATSFAVSTAARRKVRGELTLDHILPRSRGGDNSPVNIVTACVHCNNRKGNRTPDEARMPLLTSQTALRVKLERVVLCHYAEARAEWRKYLFMDMHDDRDVVERGAREQKG